MEAKRLDPLKQNTNHALSTLLDVMFLRGWPTAAVPIH